MCKCIETICEGIKNKKGDIGKHPKFKNLEIESVECDIEILSLTDGLTIAIPFTINHKPVGRKRKTSISVTTDICPICGEKREKATT